MAEEPNFCFTNMYDDVLTSSLEPSSNGSIIFNLSVLRDKVQQVQSLAAVFVAQSQVHPSASESTRVSMDHIGGLLQEIIVIASNVMFACQNVSLGATPNNPSATHDSALLEKLEFDKLTQPNGMFEWTSSGGNVDNGFGNVTCDARNEKGVPGKLKPVEQRLSPKSYDIIEMDAADLLAKYTHYCQVCGKGFKRDANLRMHMRAHGDEYKSVAALANPNGLTGPTSTKPTRKYSCPQEGCRWNRKHAKFQPLKSMVCMKNHYKRSHCPKMYACKRCNHKQFSVLSDLRTHEKHCGDVKWRCSCGTTFSRKDKLMGHIGLFVGHTPVVGSSSSIMGQ